ncbi:hypothetical protein HOK31_14095 [Candidatus Poribacteria bacterium]|nr:hypothetical protein [Candidatus Poribacteria bacterium]
MTSTASGEISTGDIECELSGASRLTLDGSGGALKVDATGASSRELVDFATLDADIDLRGASSAEINAAGEISATLSGASRLEYRGGGTLTDISVDEASTRRSSD